MTKKSKYDSRRENFIRQYAKLNDISISESRLFYEKEYQNMSDKQRRKIMTDMTNKIKEKYPSRHPSEQKGEKEFKRPKQKIKKVQRVNYEKLKEQTQGHKTQKRVLRASLKYPLASKYELQHGYNSKASQKYRARHKND